MSVKHSYTTADYLPWETAMSLIRKLYKDGKIRLSLLVGCGCFFGLRISDLLALTWRQILNAEEFVIVEQKTQKRRVVRINRGYQGHIKDCAGALGIGADNMDEPCFLNRFGSTTTIQMINRHFKWMRVQYNLRISNFSTHTLRKTWAREIWERENRLGKGELALLKLSEIMNHTSPSITRRYIGLRQQELGEVYDSLVF